MASLDGLDGLSFGKLAADTGLSKAGVQTLFRTKEALQLATAKHARELFVEAVVAPTETTPRGLVRLRTLVENWLSYARTPLFAGGCFWVATLAEFDSRPGPVRDVLREQRQQWTAVLARELQNAFDAGEIPQLDGDLVAFQLDAVLRAANTDLQLGDDKATDRVHRTLEQLVAKPDARW